MPETKYLMTPKHPFQVPANAELIPVFFHMLTVFMYLLSLPQKSVHPLQSSTIIYLQFRLLFKLNP